MKRMTSDRERQKGKKRKRERPTDTNPCQMTPLTDSRIIYQNIAPTNGSATHPLGKNSGREGPPAVVRLQFFFLLSIRVRKQYEKEKRVEK